MIGRNKARAGDDAPTLQYANGKTVFRATIGSGRFAPLVGFHIEVGRSDALDEAMRAAKVGQIEIKHQRTGGAEIVRHWSLGETIRFYPVTSGPVATTVGGSLSGKNARLTSEAGIGMRWGQGERSKVAVRGFLDALVRVDALILVQLSVRSRMTDVLIAALLDHGRVCEAADGLIDRGKHPDVVTFHEVALPLGPGEEQEWGKGDTATVVPFTSLHPAAVDADYLRGVWRPDAVHGAAYAAWEGIQEWAREYAAKDAEGQGSTGEGDDEPPTPPTDGRNRPVPVNVDPATGEILDEPADAPAPVAAHSGPPRDPAEAEQRFFARYGDVVGGQTWPDVQRFLGQLMAKPESVETWIAVAEQVRDLALHGPPAEPAADPSDPDHVALVAELLAMIAAAGSVGVALNPQSLPAGWERRPVADLRQARIKLRRVLVDAVKGLWRAELDRGIKTPARELTTDLEGCSTDQLLQVVRVASARAAKRQPAAA
jgi:hypothetical protein